MQLSGGREPGRWLSTVSRRPEFTDGEFFKLTERQQRARVTDRARHDKHIVVQLLPESSNFIIPGLCECILMTIPLWIFLIKHNILVIVFKIAFHLMCYFRITYTSTESQFEKIVCIWISCLSWTFNIKASSCDVLHRHCPNCMFSYLLCQLKMKRLLFLKT